MISASAHLRHQQITNLSLKETFYYKAGGSTEIGHNHERPEECEVQSLTERGMTFSVRKEKNTKIEKERYVIIMYLQRCRRGEERRGPHNCRDPGKEIPKTNWVSPFWVSPYNLSRFPAPVSPHSQ